jgi:hypothetical protein
MSYYYPNVVFTTDSPTPIIPSMIVQNYQVEAVRISQPLPDWLDLDTYWSTRETVTKHFLYKTIDKWLNNDLDELLNYLVSEPNGVRLLKDLDEFDEQRVDRDKQSDFEKKVLFIEDKFLSFNNVYDLLDELVKESNLKWTDLQKREYVIKDMIKHYLKKKLKNAIKSQKK